MIYFKHFKWGISMIKQYTLLLFFLAPLAFAMSGQYEQQQNIKYRQQCLEIQKFLVKNKFPVSCHYNYHQYNDSTNSYRNDLVRKVGKIKIAGFNLWHPGSTKTAFKDYELVAKTINQWDLVGAVELLPVIGDDLKNNESVIKFIQDGPKLIAKLEETIAKLKSARTARQQEQYKAKVSELAQLKKDLKNAPKLYRSPGHLLLLEQLRKLDKSWALILSPRGEAAKETHVQELAGFFYRSSIVRPKVNQYCLDYRTNGEGTPVACIPNFNGDFMGKDYRHVFSRRPLMASFVSGSFDFTILTSHIVFNSPTEQTEEEAILNAVFGQSDLVALGTGINSSTYARFAETATILRFMEKLRQQYDEDDVILVGDFNLEANNQFWPNVLQEMPGASILVQEPTSITVQRFSGANETFGHASNYDHFILDPQRTSECNVSTAKRVSIVDGAIGKMVDRRYKIRTNEKDENDFYIVTEGAAQLIEKSERDLWNKQMKLKTIVRNKIVEDLGESEKRLQDFHRRMFVDQASDKTYYRMYMEAISDHSPIEMQCSTN